MAELEILGISGSLRADSLNSALIRALQVLAPPSMKITLLTLEDIPPYCEDTDIDPAPAAVQKFRDAVSAADGLVICSPEYSRGISGVLKNALDWACRPVYINCIFGKVTLPMVATESSYHGLNALTQLTAILDHFGNYVIESDYVLHRAHERLGIDPEGRVRLTDSWQADAIRHHLSTLEEAILSDRGTAAAAAPLKFAHEMIFPRRDATGYPLTLRQISYDEIEMARDAW
jgi:chromate reductase